MGDAEQDRRLYREPGHRVRLPHLGAGLTALVWIGAVLLGGLLYARSVESRYLHALAPILFDQKNLGSSLQAAAFRQSDLLPFYAASELNHGTGPYYPSQIFEAYPTGFTPFMVGRQGITPLLTLQDLAAVGEGVRGKKLAVQISFSWLADIDALRPDYYAGNFSRLHACELAFSTDLSLPLKQEAARRMLLFPSTLEGEPLLRFALQRLAEGSAVNQALYYAAFPLGKLEALILRLQDGWQTLDYIRQQPDLAVEVSRLPARLDWPSMLPGAEQQARQSSASNPWGYDDQKWRIVRTLHRPELKPGGTEARFLTAVQESPGWDDLSLLLRGLKELGARPLLLAPPMKGVFYDYVGISYAARKVYYDRRREALRSSGMAVADFADYDADRYFVIDIPSHLSPKGWVYYAQAMDAFFHDALR